jgi:hypothetical protein
MWFSFLLYIKMMVDEQEVKGKVTHLNFWHWKSITLVAKMPKIIQIYHWKRVK